VAAVEAFDGAITSRIDLPFVVDTTPPRLRLVSAAPLIGAGGEYEGTVGVLTDITALRGLQQERDGLIVRLLEQEKLATIGTLAAGVGHEINNPLACTLLSLEVLRRMLAEATATADLAEWVTRAEGARADCLSGALRIRDIASELRDFGRPDTDQRTAVPVVEALERALRMAAHQIEPRAAIVRSFGDVPLVMACPGRLEQVFLNLLLNAAHAIGKGDPTHHRITIATYLDGDRVCASIADTGAGILPEHLPRLFEPFFTTKPSNLGTGLGLAICRDIVRRHHGEIAVESTVGEGTKFVVGLPRMGSAEEAA
jgi:signal transduction histidine kinase